MFKDMFPDKLLYGWCRGFLVLLVCLQISCASKPKYVTLLLEEPPSAAPGADPIFAAGTFNNWNAADPSYQLVKNITGQYQLLLPVRAGSVEFKFTRGSWQTVETNAAGEDIANRTLALDKPATITLQIEGWKDQLKPVVAGKSTAAANVQIIKDAFKIPQLDRSRRVWIYLPPDYTSSNKRYPVLYMHDGQNLFDKATSFSGEWGVDEVMNSLVQEGKTAGAIVVGIDNGDSKRMAEYSPWKNKEHGGGEGAAYMRFVVATLKPYIDKHYRTLPAQKYTGLAGSSLGALISFYGALEYPGVFGKIGVFSPAFWFNPELFKHTKQRLKPGAQQDFYFVASELESETMVPLMQEMQQIMLDKGISEDKIKYKVTADGAHSEWYWNREFPEAFLWLYR